MNGKQVHMLVAGSAHAIWGRDLKVRKPNVKGIMQAKKATVDVRDAGVGASQVRVVSCSMPPAKPAGKTFEGGAAAADVARLLREEANVL